MRDRGGWCSRKESNLRPPPYQGGALPTELREQRCGTGSRVECSMERETGIEPAPSAWKAEVLPLNYSRTGTRLPHYNLIAPQFVSTKPKWWREVDSNHRRRKPADLQSAPVGRLGIPPAFFLPVKTARDFGAISRFCQRRMTSIFIGPSQPDHGIRRARILTSAERERHGSAPTTMPTSAFPSPNAAALGVKRSGGDEKGALGRPLRYACTDQTLKRKCITSPSLTM